MLKQTKVSFSSPKCQVGQLFSPIASVIQKSNFGSYPPPEMGDSERGGGGSLRPSRLHAPRPRKSGVSPACLQHPWETLGARLTDEATLIFHRVIPTSPSLASPTSKCRLGQEWKALTEACQAPSADPAYVLTGSTEGMESSGKGVQDHNLSRTHQIFWEWQN